jgi:ABC-type bacteriocin/lantibiotic exporter with double-glycine peptidase domain
MVEHDQSILQYADWIIRLDNGKMVNATNGKHEK